MTVFWICASALLAVVWVLCIVDIVRRHSSAGKTFGWIALVLLVPYLGAVIYFMVRKPTAEEAEQRYLADADARQHMRR